MADLMAVVLLLAITAYTCAGVPTTGRASGT